jgi:CTP:molybdopterin cytidylyltransferase MocA
MGFDKAVTPLHGREPLARVVAALEDRDCVVVVPSRLAATVSAMVPAAAVAINDQPERGMAHSLRCGLGGVSPERAFGVLLADMPAISQAVIARTEALLVGGIDVAYPVGQRGEPGHPVLFSPRARRIVESCGDGDTLRRARDDATLTRATWVCTDRSAFADLDEPAQWSEFSDA